MTRRGAVATRDPFAIAAEIVDPQPDPYRGDPAAWVREVTHEHPWSKQVEILEALATHRKVAVKACHGPGKSFIAGRAVGHWIDTHPAGDAFAVTSAPTARQVSAVLWREIRTCHLRGKLPGRVLGTDEWKLDGGVLVGLGRKPADHDPDGFQGLHARAMLVVLDEAGGIPESLWVAADTLVTNDAGRILAIGNPDHAQSEFARVCAGSPEPDPDTGVTPSGLSDLGWWVITISTFDTPAFTGEHVPASLLEYLPSRTWLAEFAARYGLDSPLYMSKVLGRFPDDDFAGVIPWSWLRRCATDEALDNIGGLRLPVELGVDVGGSDEGDASTVAARAGMQSLGIVDVVRSGDSEVVADAVVEQVRDLRATSVKVDAIGVGHGLVGSLRRRLPREVPWPVVVHAVKVSERSSEPAEFVNLRAELWWNIGRELSRSRSWHHLDLDDDTANELRAPRYFARNGRVQIESKAEIRKRLRRSTDRADAVLLSFYVPPVTGAAVGGEYDQGERLDGRR